MSTAKYWSTLHNARLFELLAEDGVGIAQDVQLFARDVADDADGQAGAGEGLPFDERIRQAEAVAERTDLVLKQAAQRFDNALEIHVVRAGRRHCGGS